MTKTEKLIYVFKWTNRLTKHSTLKSFLPPCRAIGSLPSCTWARTSSTIWSCWNDHSSASCARSTSLTCTPTSPVPATVLRTADTIAQATFWEMVARTSTLRNAYHVSCSTLSTKRAARMAAATPSWPIADPAVGTRAPASTTTKPSRRWLNRNKKEQEKQKELATHAFWNSTCFKLLQLTLTEFNWFQLGSNDFKW